MLRKAFLTSAFLLCAVHAAAQEQIVVASLANAIEQLAQFPCEGDACDQEALAVVRQLVPAMRATIIRAYEVADPGPASSDAPREALLPFWGLGSWGFSGRDAAGSCPDVRWEANVEPVEDDENAVRISLEVSGECDCAVSGGAPIGLFRVSREAVFRFEALDSGYVALFLDPESAVCTVNTDCACPVYEETEADLLPPEDPVPVASPIRTHIYIDPRDTFEQALEGASCYGGSPCDPFALEVAKAAIAEAIPTDAYVNLFAVHWSPGDDLTALVNAEIERNMEGEDPWRGLLYERTVRLDCGDVMVRWIAKLDPYVDNRLNTWLFVYGSPCSCAFQDGVPIEGFHYQYFASFEQRVDDSGLPGVRRVTFESLEVGSCTLSTQCCGEAPAADALPGSETYVLSFDSPLWCTYGGGSIPLLPPGYAPPAQTPAPSYLPVPVPGSPAPPVPGAPSTPGGSEPPVSAAPPIPAAPGQTSTPGNVQIPGLPPAPPADSPEEPEVPLPPGDTEDPEAPPPEGGDEPPPPGPVILVFKATTATLAAGEAVPAQNAVVQINTGDPAMVAGDPQAERNDAGHDEPEYSASTDDQGYASIAVPASLAAQVGQQLRDLVVNPSVGTVLQFPGSVTPEQVLSDPLLPYVGRVTTLGGATYIAVLIPEHLAAGLQSAVDGSGATSVEPNVCIDPMPLADPYFFSQGSWSQSYPDQWGIQRVGFTDGGDSAWDLVEEPEEPVIIAVVDSGLDWDHLEIDWDVLWRNDGEVPDNGRDDDGNGYVDDTIGWDFWDDDRSPWDVDGHGTFVAGVMFANPDNAAGIAGVSRHARLMVLKAMNAFGHTRASEVAAAIKYAVDNGARVVNLSLGGRGESTVVREAIDYAYSHDVVVVVAAGNEAVPAEGQSVAGLPNALTVAAVGLNDKRAIYSNYGRGVDIAAPGDDILSLRARRTDLLKNIPGVDYQAESAFVGEDRRYYRASGTSFAAPIVAGIAGLLIANRPELTAAEVIRVLKQSAEDVEMPGPDHFTGYGLVDARAALRADPAFYIDAEISGVEVGVENGQQVVRVLGTADADRWQTAQVFIGQGPEPQSWQPVGTLERAVQAGQLAGIPSTEFAGATQWVVRLVVEHADGRNREYRFVLNLG